MVLAKNTGAYCDLLRGTVVNTIVDKMRLTAQLRKNPQIIIDRAANHSKCDYASETEKDQGFGSYEHVFVMKLEGNPTAKTFLAIGRTFGRSHDILLQTNGTMPSISRWSLRSALKEILQDQFSIIWFHSHVTHFELAVDIAGIRANQLGGWVPRIKQVMSKFSNEGEVLTLYYGDRLLKIYNKGDEIAHKFMKNKLPKKARDRIPEIARMEYTLRRTKMSLSQVSEMNLRGELPDVTIFDFDKLNIYPFWDNKWNMDLRINGTEKFLKSFDQYRREYRALIDSATITEIQSNCAEDGLKKALDRLAFFNPERDHYDRKPKSPTARYEHRNYISPSLRKLARAECGWSTGQLELLKIDESIKPTDLDYTAIARETALALIREGEKTASI